MTRSSDLLAQVMTDTDGGKRKLVDNLEEEGDGTKMQRVGDAEDEELVYDDDDDDAAAAEDENPKRKTAAAAKAIAGRGLHSSTFQLNLSALYGMGGARRGCVARVKGVGGV